MGESGGQPTPRVTGHTTPPRLQDLGPRGPTGERVRLSLRIVTHLALAGISPSDGIARFESTQRGIAKALSITQGAVSKILRPLVAAEVIRAERRHVRGLDRRVKSYTLTARGDQLALGVRARLGAKESIEEYSPGRPPSSETRGMS